MFFRQNTIFAARFLESGTYKEIFGGGAAAYIQLLLLRYQHVHTYPYQQWVVHSPLSPWRLERAQPQRLADRHHRHPVQLPVGGSCVLSWT